MATEALPSSLDAAGGSSPFPPELKAELQSLIHLNPGDLHDIKTNLQTLNKAIEFNRKSAKVTPQILRVPENHFLLRMGRLHLFQMLSQKSNMTKDIETLHEAIELGWAVLLETPVRTSQLADVFYELGFLLTSLYEHAGWGKDLDNSITMHRFAVALTPKSHERFGHRLSQVGYGLSARVNLTNSLQDLDEAINVSKWVLSMLPQHTPEWLMEGTNLGARYCVKYKLTGRDEVAEEAYRISQELISRTKPGDQIYAPVLNNLVVSIGARFERTGFQRDLEEAIRVGRLAMKYVPEADENRASIMRTFSSWLCTKYKLVGDVSILREAISLSDQVVAGTPPDGLESFRAHVKRSDLWTELFEKTNELGDLDKALEYTAQTANFVPLTEQKLWFRMHKQVALLAGNRFIINRHVMDWLTTLYMAITIISKANLEELPDKLKDAEYREKTLEKAAIQAQRFGTVTEEDKHGMKAGDVVYEMYKRNIETMDFVDAFEAVLNEPAEIPMYFKDDTLEEMQEFCKHLESFGLSDTFRIRLRFGLPRKPSKTRSDDGEDVQFEYPSTASIMELSKILRKQLNKSTGESDLNRLSSLAESTLALNTFDTLGYPDMLRVFVDILNEQFSRSGNVAYAMRVIPNIDQILSMLDDDDDDRAEYEGEIARLLQVRSRHTGSKVDIANAANHLERALELTPENAANRLKLQFNLAMILRTKHQYYGRLEDLEECIRNAKIAMSSMSKSEARSSSINFALILRSSYTYLGSVSDLQRAAESLEEALKEYEGCDSISYVEIAIRSNLGLVLGDLYKAKNNVEDLKRAIKLIRDLVGRTKTMDNPQFGNLALNLAINLEKSYNLTGDRNELDEAISICKLMIKNMPLDHPQRGYLLVDAGSIIMRTIGKDMLDLDTLNFAIGIFEEVERINSPEQSASGVAAFQLGYTLEKKNKLEPSEGNISRCTQAFTRGWQCEGSFPTVRIQSAWRAARYLQAQGQVGEAAKLLRDSITLLTTMARKIAEREGQLNLLSLFPGLAGDAALVALEDGQAPSQALQLLELGRNITNATTMDHRSELIELDHEEYPEIVRRFNQLRMEVDVATHGDRLANAAEAAAWTKRQSDVQSEMNSLLEEVRCLPGYENTLGPQSPQDWINLADGGPIVVVAASGLVGRSDAIIIQKSGITSLPLLDLDYAEAHFRMEDVFRVARGPPSTFADRNQTMQDHLSWIWNVAVQPILQELDFLAPKPGSKLPVICWVGVGILANMPFHAAGDHREGSDMNTLSKCVSSYVPTLRSLLHTRLRRPKRYLNRKRDARMLVVTMPTSPPGKGQALPSVLDESDAVLESAASVPLTTTALNLPSVSSVIQNMAINNLVHFACHGRPDPKNPLQSHLVLNDGDLSVADIARSLAAEADLAYLSACSTADREDGKLVDEGIHVVSSFQLAGFRNVIGTLWETVDWACSEAAEEFYKSLFANDPEEPTWDGKWRFSRALHSAVTKLRANDPDLPLLWAPFVHFGGE